jgi:hypothetical protein
MNYELKDTNWVGAPKVKATDPTKVEVYVNVTTGVVGDTYGFTKVDTVLMDFPISMTGSEMQANTDVQGAAYVATTYPNT